MNSDKNMNFDKNADNKQATSNQWNQDKDSATGAKSKNPSMKEPTLDTDQTEEKEVSPHTPPDLQGKSQANQGSKGSFRQ